MLNKYAKNVVHMGRLAAELFGAELEDAGRGVGLLLLEGAGDVAVLGGLAPERAHLGLPLGDLVVRPQPLAAVGALGRLGLERERDLGVSLSLLLLVDAALELVGVGLHRGGQRVVGARHLLDLERLQVRRDGLLEQLLGILVYCCPACS